MEHWISPQQWLDFVDRTLTPSEEARITAHVSQCKDCEVLMCGLMDWHRLLTQETQLLRHSLVYLDVEIDRLLDHTLNRIRPVGMKSHWTWSVLDALVLLRCLMAPISGPSAARAVMAVAFDRSGMTPGRCLNHDQWSQFLSNLSEAFGSICGLEGARLIGHAGRSLSIDYGCY